jgi:hypothetical protein
VTRMATRLPFNSLLISLFLRRETVASTGHSAIAAAPHLHAPEQETSMNEKKCAHDACHCTGDDVLPNGYCSESCQTGRMENGRCGCGHPPCK